MITTTPNPADHFWMNPSADSNQSNDSAEHDANEISLECDQFLNKDIGSAIYEGQNLNTASSDPFADWIPNADVPDLTPSSWQMLDSSNWSVPIVNSSITACSLVDTSSTFTSSLLSTHPINFDEDDETISSSSSVKHVCTIPVAQFALHQPANVSSPLFRSDGFMMVGISTDDEKEYLCVSNYHSMNRTGQCQLFPLSQRIEDTQWINDSMALVAISSKLCMMRLPSTLPNDIDEDNFHLKDCLLEEFSTIVHSDTIREVAVSNDASVRILSGGFDRTLCISPLERMDNVQSHLSSAPVMRSNTFRRFYTHDVVSSVRWRTADPNGCSWTGDGGLYQLIDCRAGSLAMKFNVSQHINFSITGGTFSHEYLTPDEFGVSFGFEHGQMAIFDIRKFKNPCVGEIHHSTDSKLIFCGRGGYTIARIMKEGADNFRGIEVIDEKYPLPDMTTSGKFVRHLDDMFGMATSTGEINLVELK